MCKDNYFEGEFRTDPKTIEIDLVEYFEKISTSAEESKALKVIVERLRIEDQKIWKTLMQR